MPAGTHLACCALVKRAYRLRREADFQHVRASKRSWTLPALVLYVAPNDLAVTRLGVSVGKRVGKHAVLRNRIRRRVREAVRLRYSQVMPGHDLLFIARAPSAQATWLELSDAVERLLRRAGLLAERRTGA